MTGVGSRYQRIYVREYLGNNRAIFECKLGHTWRSDVIKRPERFPKSAWKQPDESICRAFARYWSRERGGAHGVCPKCRRSRSDAKSGIAL